MNKRLLSNLLIFLGMGVGILTGFFEFAAATKVAEHTADLFLRLLKLISLPIIFLSITATISGMRDFQEMRQMGRRVFVYTLGTTIAAATIALILFVTFDPAKSAHQIQTAAAGAQVTEGGSSYVTFLLNIIPSNVIQAFVDNNVIGVAFLAFALSISILFLPKEQKETLHKFFAALFAATLKITGGIIALMPIAIWAFVTLLMKDVASNTQHVSSLMVYLACVAGANLIQGVIVLPVMLKIKGISPWKAFKGMSPALTLAFLSKSSNATLPVTMRSAEKNLGVSSKVSSFSLPLCSVINMNGCAAFILTTVLFVSTLHGVTFTTFDYVGWIFLATIAAVGNAGVPMGCFFLTSAFLVGMNIPLYTMGLILPFYAFLDMLETALNVWSDACVAISVDRDVAGQEAVLEAS